MTPLPEQPDDDHNPIDDATEGAFDGNGENGNDVDHNSGDPGGDVGDDDDDDDGDDGDDDDGELDWALIARMFEIALADFRLDRAHLPWSTVAAAVDAVFHLCDPAHLLEDNREPLGWIHYNQLVVRVWHNICASMMGSEGVIPGTLTIDRLEIDNILREALDDEFGDDGSSNDAEIDDRNPRGMSESQFAEIIGNEFGVSVRAQSGRAPRGTSRSGVDGARVSLMTQLLHQRLAQFPWDGAGDDADRDDETGGH